MSSQGRQHEMEAPLMELLWKSVNEGHVCVGNAPLGSLARSFGFPRGSKNDVYDESPIGVDLGVQWTTLGVSGR